MARLCGREMKLPTNTPEESHKIASARKGTCARIHMNKPLAIPQIQPGPHRLSNVVVCFVLCLFVSSCFWVAISHARGGGREGGGAGAKPVEFRRFSVLGASPHGASDRDLQGEALREAGSTARTDELSVDAKSIRTT